MMRLEPDRYSVAAPLLTPAPFNVLMGRAVLDGRVRGEVFVDSAQPSSVYVRHKYGMSFLIGYSETNRFRTELIARLADGAVRSSPEWLQVFPLDWTELLDPLVDDGLIRRWGRTNFWFNKTRFLSRFGEQADTGVTIGCTSRPLEQFTGSVIPTQFWNGPDEFLASGAGYFSLEGDAAAAVAFASYLDDTHMEIGVETLPDYRGRGHAQRACARLISDCIQRGLTPVWSCRTENEGSFRLAERLGFVPVLQLPYYELAWSRRRP